ncbi:TlpA family protein disulfide reductase [Desertibaculum subflavum]|uniref:TlpA family protein disulfide reductase n=1 Tax=Desertibaculum subflavum TaxID=2268458 RepID=UPI0013C48C49
MKNWFRCILRLVAGVGLAATLAGAASAADLARLATGAMKEFRPAAPAKPVGEIAFEDKAGAKIGLDAFKGRVVLLNLWATWCAPCREEMPSLDRLQAALGSKDFEVVALSLDRAGRDKAKGFLDQIGVKHLALYIDPTMKAGRALDATGMPTTILIGRDGKELGRLIGPAEWDSKEAKALIQAAIAAKPAG